ncbi:putative bifunctional diguanylate cyclase/phosphodiesterase [Pseudidiomarina aestuarii]|uniref:putative bifunctional diguanylate cyclase/phosphodiesterase n=1 Tax=Pseudidiomarina aestuarii TaxID=624146 RepID=UPI003A97150D
MQLALVDHQVRAVLHTIVALALTISGLAILVYRLGEPTQQLIYHSVSSSLLVSVIATGAALLAYVSRIQRWHSVGPRLLGVLVIAASVDGCLGSYLDSFDTRIHSAIYIGFIGVGAWLVARPKAPLLMRLQLAYGVVLVIAALVLLLLHYALDEPFVARHPTGSLIACIVLLLAGVALINLGVDSNRVPRAVAPMTTVIASVGLVAVLVVSVAMFHSEMSGLRTQGQQAADSLNANRRLAGIATITMLERMANRWQSYPYEEHDALMREDIAGLLQDVEFIESFILLTSAGQPVWEIAESEDMSYQHLIFADANLQARLQEFPEPLQLLVPAPEYTQEGAMLMIRQPVRFQETEGYSPWFSLVTVIDVPTMLAAQVAQTNSPIMTYTEVSYAYLMNKYGEWVSTDELERIREQAIFLHGDALNTPYSAGTPIVAYMIDLTDMQAMANLQVLVAIAGIGLVMLVSLTIERNRTLMSQGRQLKFQAEHDALTGLFNRTTIERHLNERFNQSRQLTVMFIDLDGFTLINDSLGLQVGDRLLQLLAQRLENVVGGRAQLARFGGDEFLLVAEHLHHDTDAVNALTQRILSAVAQPYRIMQHKIYLTASIGVAHQTSDQYAPLELVQRADMAMHQAKRLGHNHVQVYQDSMSLQFKSSAAMRSSLQEAIEKQQLRLHYQPIVRCNDLQVVGYEALLRWEREPGKFVPPSEFIPLAEMTGQIIPLSEWVFRQAFTDAVEFQKEGPRKISVNLSTLHFNRSEFADHLEQTLAETGCKPEWIELELTESILMENTDYAIAVLNRLRQQQFSIALDDFGTGFSSLSYLKRLPMDKVKIDRSFIQGIRTHKSDRVLVSSVIKIAQSLDFAVVAEGVETTQQAEFVTELGCNYMQGYYFGRPTAKEDL